MLPHVLTIAEETEPAAERTRVRVTTRKSSKEPWKSVQPRTIEIPKRWLIELCTSNSMAAFSARTIKAIIPVDAAGNLLAQRDIEEDGWKLLDEQYTIHAGAGKQTPRRLLDRIDYLRNLSVQLPLQPETQREAGGVPEIGRHYARRTLLCRARGC